MNKRTIYLALLAALWCRGAHAGGFQLSEQSARGAGMGGALMAATGDPTSVHLNPAALGFLHGTHFSFGSTVIVPEQRFNGVSPSSAETKMQAQVLFPPNVYLTHTFGNSWGLGVAFHIPYEAKTEWNPDWVGGRLATKSDLRVAMVTPSLGVRFSDDLSFGVGIDLAIPKILLEQRIPVAVAGDPTVYPDGYTTHEASGSMSAGFLLGVLYRPSEHWSFGASYRTRIAADLDDGRVSFRDIPAAISPQYVDGKFASELTIPSQLHAGTGWQPVHWIYASADLEYTMWSEFKSIEITYSNPDRIHRSINEHWNNTLNLRFGVEFSFATVSLRGGYRIEKGPVPDRALTPGLPDADATALSLGLGYRIGGRLLLDFAFVAMHYDDRLVSGSEIAYDGSGAFFNGLYTSRASSIAINVLYSWE
jgi:long-chain fatty acid transport protein